MLVPASTQQSEVEQLLNERRGLFSIQLTTDKATALWQELAPHVSVCVAPRVGVESHPVEDFRMIVPEQARRLGLQPLALRVAASGT